jgi:hypothetical protein
MNLTDILHKAGLYYDPTRHAGQSFIVRSEPTTFKADTNKEIDTSKRHWVKGRSFVDKGIVETDNVLSSEWDREDGVFRSSELNARDEGIIKVRRLDKAKYIQYKELWAEGLSIAQASAEATRRYGRGYKERTTDDYYSAINAANPSPTHTR